MSIMNHAILTFAMAKPETSFRFCPYRGWG